MFTKKQLQEQKFNDEQWQEYEANWRKIKMKDEDGTT
jgi:hypothetical protein